MNRALACCILILTPIILWGKRVELIADWPISERDALYCAIEKVLKEKGDALALFDLAETTQPFTIPANTERVVFWNMPQKMKKKFSSLPKDRLVLFMWEPPTVQKRLYKSRLQDGFSKIYTWDDDLIDGKKFFKFYYPVLQPRRDPVVPFEQKKLCTLIFSNKHSKHPQELYSEREEVIKFFEQQVDADFEFYGWGWEKAGYANYRGAVADKIDVLRGFRFCFCYENMQGRKGYITEKIFDCFAAGCIPIYWGASNIEKYIPEDCFIDRRRFKNNDEVYAFIKKMSPEEYNGYLMRISNWLNSERADRFSMDHFAKTFMESVD